MKEEPSSFTALKRERRGDAKQQRRTNELSLSRGKRFADPSGPVSRTDRAGELFFPETPKTRAGRSERTHYVCVAIVVRRRCYYREPDCSEIENPNRRRKRKRGDRTQKIRKKISAQEIREA